MLQKIYKSLNSYGAKLFKNYIKVKIPLVIWTNGDVLELKIKQSKDGFTVYCPTNIFLDANEQGDQDFYVNIFEKHDKNYHYDIKIKNGKIYKNYQQEASVTVAINEFIRYYVMLDDFILKNDVIGNEQNFI